MTLSKHLLYQTFILLIPSLVEHFLEKTNRIPSTFLDKHVKLLEAYGNSACSLVPQ